MLHFVALFYSFFANFPNEALQEVLCTYCSVVYFYRFNVI